MKYQLTVESKQKVEFIDITGEINSILTKNKIKEGLCAVFVKHTTAAVIVTEAEENLLSDFERLINLVPKSGYSHGHGDPGHTPAHILSSVISPSVTIPVVGGQLDLGTWQRVIFIELHGPRKREINLAIVKALK